MALVVGPSQLSAVANLFGKGLIMPPLLVPLALSASLLIAASSSVPNFDPGPGCQIGAQTGVELHPNVAACVRQEQRAKNSLRKDWQSFSESDKNSCVANALSDGPPSYIELLTCLEIAGNRRII
jgi:hypothetical protein